jgi:hypothetical protein
VNPRVYDPGIPSGKALVAEFTWVGLLARVDTDMSLQLIRGSKDFTAFSARIRLVSCMDTHVHLERLQDVKAFTTFCAFVDFFGVAVTRLHSRGDKLK